MIDKLTTIEERYDEIERLLADPDVSSEYSRVESLAKEQASIRNLVFLSREYRKVTSELEDIHTMLREESDQALVAMAKDELARLGEDKRRVEHELRLALIPRDPNDEKSVIMEIRAGTGGDEAGLFAAELFRVYLRYAQRMRWRTEVIDANETGLGAIKEMVFQVKGKGAYSRLKHESGVHRVQRIPVTESGGRIHTSAATVAVLPEADEVDVDMNLDDLQIETFHASGHGGQHVQKVATAVRITHTPTGIVAVCQDERSQFRNKDKAMAVLRSRILAREIQRQHQQVSETRRSQIGSGDRSERIRTYNFPQNRVTDHRIGLTSHNLEAVLDGDIGHFINALVEQEQTQLLGEASM